jgi:hypothetical protein
MSLTVAEFREYVATSLSDDALQRLLDAAWADIEQAAGPMGDVVEFHPGGYRDLVLDRDAGTVSLAREAADGTSPLTLDPTDFRVDGLILRRLRTGPNPRDWWMGEVEVTHAPAEDEAERERAQAALVQLDMSAGGSVASERIGEYAVSYGNGGGRTVPEQRQDILAEFQAVMAR